MGTRHLIAVALDGDYKIAQYGQWDGYPEVQGVAVLRFLAGVDIEEFKTKVRKCRFMSPQEIQELPVETWKETHYQLSRDCGADILRMVMDGVTELEDSISFAGDSVFCTYCYVVDLDQGTFEVFAGLNKEPITEGRFVSGDERLSKVEGMEPVKLAQTFLISKLPSEEQFLKQLAHVC